ncbi:MAG TPA: SDR family NAD-dependent epimerase/dehydratase, partial [Bacteroidales bacterium]|nr:SDR family NAD-dependent epimerase/dehydratase [Bacteroidales bacterium]
LIEGLIRLMDSPDDFTGPVNLGNPGEFTILELAQMTIRMTKSSSALVYQPLPADDPLQRKPDISLARSVLNWEPTIDLETGLGKTISYFRDHM